MNGSGSESRRDYIIRVASRLFRERGYERTTIRELASAVDLQSGSLFHYFASKDDILYAVIADAMQKILEKAEVAIRGSFTTEQMLRQLIRCELDAVTGETANGMHVSAFEWRKLPETHQQRLIEIRNRYEQIWRQVLDLAHKEELIAIDPLLLRRFLNGALSWTCTWFRTDGAQSLDDLTDAALTMALRAPVNA